MELLNLIRANESLLSVGIKRIEQAQLAYVVFLTERIRNVKLAKIMQMSPAACRGAILSLEKLRLLRTETINREHGGRDLWVVPTPYLRDVLLDVSEQLRKKNKHHDKENKRKTTSH